MVGGMGASRQELGVSHTGICGVRTHIMNELAHDMHTWAAQYPAVQDYM